MAGWKIWVDRGGTFTDLIAVTPNGQYKTHKLLSVNPSQYFNSAIQGIRDLLQLSYEQPIPTQNIDEVKVGTTVATNALLERKGESVALVTTKGFKDALKIAMQNRPDIFALDIQKPEQIYQTAVEIEERINAEGSILTELNLEQTRTVLFELKQRGYKSIAIVLMHAWVNSQHECAVELLAQEIGFEHISVSHQVSPSIKLIPRGDTTVVDAYLTPVMQRYVQQIADQLPDVPLYFMQSNGGLALAEQFQGKDAVLSGPAGGIVGAVKTSAKLGFNKMIGFDMGGTSTDVSHCADQNYERRFQTEVAGVRLAAPMMHIHTVAAGGGSVCEYQDGRFQVGPESAGAYPGPACYRNDGPLTVTDCNLVLGKIKPELFPAVFGENADLPLDIQASIKKITAIQTVLLAQGQTKSLFEIAHGFIAIAVENMANAVKKISTQRGYHLNEYVLTSFGGAGGQHACLIADALNMETILIHPYAGVLSAYGIGLADQVLIKERSLQLALTAQSYIDAHRVIDTLADVARQELVKQGARLEDVIVEPAAHIKYDGAEVTLDIQFSHFDKMCSDFHHAHFRQFSYQQPELALMIDSVYVTARVIEQPPMADVEVEPVEGDIAQAVSEQCLFYTQGKEMPARCYVRSRLLTSQVIKGPAMIVEKTGTNVIEAGWQAEVIDDGVLKVTKLINDVRLSNVPSMSYESVSNTQSNEPNIEVDPISLEVFNNLFMSIAEQMGLTLQNTAHSVNIRERLDFSCALFDHQGQLVANAPHVPVHLGSMSHSVISIIEQVGLTEFNEGDGYLINSPYHGGTHLPDLTLVTPVFVDSNNNHCKNTPAFFVASRAHHADVGGMSPGSMPAGSEHISEEGILFTGQKVVTHGILSVSYVRSLFTDTDMPARNVVQNIADLTAQLAANNQGQTALTTLVNEHGFERVNAFMQAIQNNAELAVRNAIEHLCDGEYTLSLDQGAHIKVAITLNNTTPNISTLNDSTSTPVAHSVTIDFSGTSPQQKGNFNAPRSVTDAAVIYVFRTLVDKNIPLNAGCMRPLKVIVPDGCMLSPQSPAAVVAGNVEVSQAIVTALLLALGKTAASQTTMNNLTFGDNEYQYYETLAGGTGAGIDNHGEGFSGCDAVHSHMTNSRLTDPEVLEQRFPVLLTDFSIRQGSGGTGQYKGGNGVNRSIQFNQPMSATILSNSKNIAPAGLGLGGTGQCGHAEIVKLNGKTQVLESNCSFTLEAGDTLTIQTPGGGGYQ